ncbi:MAG: hypothetical protein ACLFRP_04310 [Puniceicoccaceae bacterium]
MGDITRESGPFALRSGSAPALAPVRCGGAAARGNAHNAGHEPLEGMDRIDPAAGTGSLKES